MFKIAVDIGYGFLKGINETGERIIFPSMVGSAHERSLKDLFGANAKSRLDNLHVHVKEGQLEGEYFVGSLAKESASKSIAFGSNKIWHQNNIILLSTATALLAPDREDILIVSGLPLEHYKTQRQEFSSFLKMFNAELRFIDHFPGHNTRKISFAGAAVFPQGAGAVYEAFLDYPEIKQKAGALVAVVDVGFKTTDYITVRIGTPLETIEYLSGTIDAGMYHLHRSFESSYLQETGYKADPGRIGEYIASGGRFFFDGRERNLSQSLQTARHELVNVIRDGLISRWNDHYREFQAVFLAGGGAPELGDSLKQTFPMLKRVNDPQFANCKGFLYYARLLESRLKTPEG